MRSKLEYLKIRCQDQSFPQHKLKQFHCCIIGVQQLNHCYIVLIMKYSNLFWLYIYQRIIQKHHMFSEQLFSVYTFIKNNTEKSHIFSTIWLVTHSLPIRQKTIIAYWILYKLTLLFVCRYLFCNFLQISAEKYFCFLFGIENFFI